MVYVEDIPDVSWWNVAWRLDQAQVKPIGIICRLMYGHHWVDPRGKEFVQQAIDEGIPWGAYQYWLANQNPLLQTNNFLDVVESFSVLPHPDLGAYEDVEDNRGLQRETVDRQLRVSLERGEVRVRNRFDWGVYTRKTFFDPFVSTDGYYARYSLWAAHYRDPSYGPWIPKSWERAGKKAKWHQWTEKANGQVFGFERFHIDLNAGNIVITLPPQDLTTEEMIKILWREAGRKSWNLSLED